MPGLKWPRADIIAAIGVIVAAVGAGAAVFVIPEIHDIIFGPAPTPKSVQCCLNSTVSTSKEIFSQKLSMSEHDAASAHGVMLKTDFMGFDMGGPYVEVTATLDNATNTQRLHDGESFKIAPFDNECDSADIAVRNIDIESKVPGVSLQELNAKFGMAAEAMVKRQAEFVVSGRCVD